MNVIRYNVNIIHKEESNVKTIAKIRREARLTQEEVAKALNVDRSTIAKWEAGEAKPHVNRLRILADLYGKSLDETLAALDEDEREAS